MNIVLIRRSFIIVAFMCVSVAFGQKSNVKKAEKEFDRFEYIDARDIYLKVVEDGYTSAQIYEQLGDTYYWNSDYDNAANWYAKLIAEFPKETKVIYFYRAAQSHKSIGDKESAERYMNMYIDNGGDSGIVNASKTKFLDYKVHLEKVGINSSSSDFGPTYYLNKVVFSSSRPGTEGGKIHMWMNQPFTDLFMADMDENGVLSNALSLGGDVNSRYHETSPTFTKDGKTMYFTRNNFIDGKKGKDSKKTICLKLYKATSSGNNNWTNVVELPFNDENYSNAHPALSADEKRLYFSSERPGGYGMSDIWYVDITGDNTYGDPVNLGPVINTEARESFPFLSKENNLYFSSDGRAGLGGFDVFMVPLDENNNPGVVSNLGEPANSTLDDFGFIFDEEKRFGYVSSNRGGEEGSLDDDIYLVKEQCEISLVGTVFDVDSGELIPGATVTLFDSESDLIESKVVGEDAAYSFMLDCEKEYVIRGTKERYGPFEKLITTPNQTGEVIIPIPLKLIDPCPVDDLGCRLTLLPIYFDFDKHNIRPDAAIELAKILVAMREYPQLIIEIESHTDSRGNDAYNEALSERRAQSTLNWLISKGVDRNRLTAKGFGEGQLINQCFNGADCTEEEHQLNRRSMFLIMN